ncbi:FAD-dependent oxidoreductase [Marinobacter salinisoli]|uniref:FAD-dependent oxidoreductase n=1 Tax=Marinobacter salinisoli TaxID=2769486 RepID=A0ABX7MNL9_9GAMM|nr:FAD-dependent oxidoreductase [Marinobacter salinisoli]QSP93823.1 FAD-dependent oxidoreductase [Marinobacter salinisoli]
MPKPNELSPSVRRTAIVGSGVAGLTAGILLKQAGQEVTVFEKSRGPGGRLAAKRVPGGSADIGAQYFTARNPAFLPFLRQYAGEGCFDVWQARLGFRAESGQWGQFPEESRYVGCPRMTAITRALSGHVTVVSETRVERFERHGNRWLLYDTQNSSLGAFDQIILTAPPAQSQDLLAASGLAQEAESLDDQVKAMLPCWAVVAHFEKAPWTDHDGMRVEDSVLYWVANNSSKPGRQDDGQWWVLHANPQWSQEQVDASPEDVASQVLSAFRELIGYVDEPDTVLAHRWLYARSEDAERPGHLWFPDHRIGLAGDWLSGGRVEGAFNSACSLIDALIDER